MIKAKSYDAELIVIVLIVAIVAIVAMLVAGRNKVGGAQESLMDEELESAVSLYKEDNLIGSSVMSERVCELWNNNAKRYDGCAYLRKYAPSRYWQWCGNELGCAISFVN